MDGFQPVRIAAQHVPQDGFLVFGYVRTGKSDVVLTNTGNACLQVDIQLIHKNSAAISHQRDAHGNQRRVCA